MSRKNKVHLTLEAEGSNSFKKLGTTHPTTVSNPRRTEFSNSSDSRTVCLEVFGHTKMLTVVLLQHTNAIKTVTPVSGGAD